MASKGPVFSGPQQIGFLFQVRLINAEVRQLPIVFFETIDIKGIVIKTDKAGAGRAQSRSAYRCRIPLRALRRRARAGFAQTSNG